MSRVAGNRALPVIVLLVALFAIPAMGQEETVAPVITLDEAHGLARQNSYVLKNLEEALKQARNLHWRAYAILLPNISLDGNVTLNDKVISFAVPDPVTGVTEDVVFQERWNKQFGATANMNLFNAQSIPLILNAEDNVEATGRAGRHDRNELLFAVSAAYYGVRSAMEAATLAQEDRKNADEFLRMAQARLRVGQGLRIEVHRAEIEVMESVRKVENAKDGLKLAKTGLAYLIGHRGDFNIDQPERPRVVEGTLDELQEQALKDRSDLGAVRIQVDIARRERDRIWMQWLPTFDATYNFAWDSATGFAGEHHSWRLIFGAKWDLLSGGQRIADLNDADSRIRQAENRMHQMELTVREEVEKKRLELVKRSRNVELAGRQQGLATENHEMVRKMYAQGLATRLELLDANTTLSRSRGNLLLENLALDLAILELRKALGEEL